MSDRARVFRLEYETKVAATIEEAFEFIADPATAALLSPAWLELTHIPAPEFDLAPGTDIEYAFRWAGIPLYLRLTIREAEPPRYLALEQTLGPWASYRHSYWLDRSSEGALIREVAEFDRWPGLVAWAVQRLLVRRQLLEIVAFHQAALRRNLDGRSA